MSFWSKLGKAMGFAVAPGAVLGYEAYKGVKKNRDTNRGFIDDSYRSASQQLQMRQSLGKQNAAESLNARGLLSGPMSPIQTKMSGGVMRATGPAPTTVGQRVQSDNAVQMGLERQDLDRQHDYAVKENKIDFANNLIKLGTGSAQLAGSVITGNPAGVAGGVQSIAGAQTPSAAPAMTLSGDPSEATTIRGAFGIHPVAPLDDPSSAWYTGKRGTLNGTGLTNDQFNTGVG